MCDTFVALNSITRDGSVLFGKNSDREPNEAQALEYHPARTYADGEKVLCTYLTIPQVKKTNAVLLSRPFWMWGAEMGANEKGVVIGNEAVFTKMPLNRDSSLTGMDLLRLALERSDSAAEALGTIVQLLADHGQGGVCGYENKKMAYHSSYILADPKEAWVLETAGRLWAARKVKDFYSISNGLTIGEEFDEHHPQLIETARQKGWLKKGKTFHFARCFSDWFYTTFSACRRRQRRSYDLINEKKGQMDPASVISILRDHRDEGYQPEDHLLIDRLCAHAANPLSRHSQSTGSLVAHLKPKTRTYWATGTSAPCTGVFKPIWLEGNALPDIGPTPDGRFNPDTLWWYHEILHRSVLMDYQPRLEVFKEERDALERSLIEKAETVNPDERNALTQAAFQQAREKTTEWIDKVQGTPPGHQRNLIYRNYWKKQNKKAGIAAR